MYIFIYFFPGKKKKRDVYFLYLIFNLQHFVLNSLVFQAYSVIYLEFYYQHEIIWRDDSFCLQYIYALAQCSHKVNTYIVTFANNWRLHFLKLVHWRRHFVNKFTHGSCCCCCWLDVMGTDAGCHICHVTNFNLN